MSSSKSSSRQDINQYDNRTVLGENAMYANNGASISVQTLDADVINAALAANGLTIDRALTFGSDTVGSALNFGSGALRESFNFGGDALAFAQTANQVAANNMANAFSDALAVSENSLSKAYTFGGNALDRAFDAVSNSQNIVATAYADAKGRGALTDKILMGAIAATALVAWAAVGKK